MALLQLQQADANAPISIEVQRIGDPSHDRFDVRIGERTTSVTLGSNGEGEGRLLIDGRTVPFYSVRRNSEILVWVGGRTYSFKLVDRTPQRGLATAAVRHELTAPMPGTVRKISVKPGDSFEAHTPLVVMESMKMELTLSAPHSGKVKAVACKVGQLVEMNAVLVLFERPSDDRPA
jgi:3-methylcrotonyl-CoA carboxylase alpha subunit